MKTSLTPARCFAFAGAAVAIAVASACVSAVHVAKSTEPVATQRKSTAATREKVSITVYNQNFGLVREIRDVELAAGRVELEYGSVSAHIQPESVALKSLDDPKAVSILEQNYRYDLLTPDKLLEKYVGKKVKVERWNDKLGRDEERDAEVVSTEEGTVLKIGDQITAGYPGRISFPGVPADLLSEPTLVWLLDSKVPKARVEVTYLTDALNWRADYVLVVDDKDQTGDLDGWVTLSNDTGTSYENAELKLVAGDVQRIRPVATLEAEPEATATASAAPQFHEEGLFEYHLYTLDRPTDLHDKEQKQVSLFEATGISVQKKLIFQGSDYYFRGRYGELATNQKVGVFIDLVNSEANHMGMPLPKGIVRVYKSDKEGSRQFIGEDQIDHTPRDEKVRIKMGEAFDVVGDRKQTDWNELGRCGSESEYEIELRNHKDEAEQVEVVEPAGGEWEIVSSSQPATKKDAHTFTFDANIPAKGKTKITYRVRVKWC